MIVTSEEPQYLRSPDLFITSSIQNHKDKDRGSFTQNTVPTQFVEAGGIRFAYRRFGKGEPIPIVLIPPILGNMDSWDPSVTDGLAQDREIILFDNAGIGSSSGEVPSTFAEMAKSVCAFIDCLRVAKVDVLGFSIGSMIAQNVALKRTELIRKLVLVGSGPRNGDVFHLRQNPRQSSPINMGISTISGSTASSRHRLKVSPPVGHF